MGQPYQHSVASTIYQSGSGYYLPSSDKIVTPYGTMSMMEARQLGMTRKSQVEEYLENEFLRASPPSVTNPSTSETLLLIEEGLL